MDKKMFYESVRGSLFSGSIGLKQFEGLESLLTAIYAAGITDARWVAYMLATAFHETGHTLQPISEYGKGNGRPYGKKIKMSGKAYSLPHQIYYGRGYVQLTWYENYAAMGKILGIPLLEQPELANTPTFAARIMVEGMTKGKTNFGDFTGKSLEDYFNSKVTDPVNARRIINGTDRAELIAGFYTKFYKALTA